MFALDSNPVKQFIREGWLLDLTPFLEKEGGAAAWAGQFYEPTIKVVSEKGGLFGAPQTYVPIVLFYNKPMLESVGVAGAPATWEAFRDAAKRLTAPSKPGGPVDRWGTTMVLGQGGFDHFGVAPLHRRAPPPRGTPPHPSPRRAARPPRHRRTCGPSKTMFRGPSTGCSTSNDAACSDSVTQGTCLGPLGYRS